MTCKSDAFPDIVDGNLKHALRVCLENASALSNFHLSPEKALSACAAYYIFVIGYNRIVLSFLDHSVPKLTRIRQLILTQQENSVAHCTAAVHIADYIQESRRRGKG